MADISRREALKRGATIGAGVLWATPAVQAVSMVRSAAAAASPPPNGFTYYAVKIEPGTCEDIWDQQGNDLDPDAPPGHCLTPNGGSLVVVPGGCSKVAAFSATDDDKTDWTVTLAAGCEIIKDDMYILTKAGRGCVKDAPDAQSGQTYTFENPAPNGKGISHLEFVICCRPVT
jgi:hypothetical protein